MDAAESEFVFAAADDEALDPASGAGALDVEVKSVAVSVPTDGRGADEGGGESVVGVAALGLGSTRFRRAWCHTIHSLIINEMVADFTRRPNPLSPTRRVVITYYYSPLET